MCGKRRASLQATPLKFYFLCKTGLSARLLFPSTKYLHNGIRRKNFVTILLFSVLWGIPSSSFIDHIWQIPEVIFTECCPPQKVADFQTLGKNSVNVKGGVRHFVKKLRAERRGICENLAFEIKLMVTKLMTLTY